MQFSVFLSVLFSSMILFIKGKISVYTKEDCMNCCNGITLNEVISCKRNCDHRFNRVTLYRSIKDCLQSCDIIHPLCREPCREDCRTTISQKRKIDDERRNKAKLLKTQESKQEPPQPLSKQLQPKTRGITFGYTKENCMDCCNMITLEEVIACKKSCDERYSRPLRFHSIKECLHSCKVIHEACRQPCLEDCREIMSFRLQKDYEKKKEMLEHTSQN